MTFSYRIDEDAIIKYGNQVKIVEKNIAQIIENLAYSDVTNLIIKADTEFIKLKDSANKLIKSIVEYRENSLGKGSLKPSLIQKEVKDLEKRLREVKIVKEIYTKELGTDDNLEKKIILIERKIKGINDKIKDEMTQDEINYLIDENGVVTYLVIIFGEILNKSKDEFNKYAIKLEQVKKSLTELRKNIGSIHIKDRKNVNNNYEGLKRELDILNVYVYKFLTMLRPNTIYEVNVENLKDDVKRFKNNLIDIVERIEEEYSNNNLDINQFNILMSKTNIIEDNIRIAYSKINDPNNAKDYDAFKRLSLLKEYINDFDERINNQTIPIRDRLFKKKMDIEIEFLEEDIKVIEMRKEVANEVLKQEKRLTKIIKEYRSNCPSLVIKTESAKRLFKGHKKNILMAGGLASLAIINAPIGLTLSPALIQGNIALMEKRPTIKPTLRGINEGIAKWVGAKMVSESKRWQLMSGTVLEQASIVPSLLKGIALSVGFTSTSISELILTIKRISNNIKKHELKKNILKSNDSLISFDEVFIKKTGGVR